MPFPAFLLRCLLALALVVGGLPSLGMANVAAPDHPATAMTSCHEPDAPGTGTMDASAMEAGCCDSTDCLCDCVHQMPAVAWALPTLPAPVFAAPVPVRRAFERASRVPSDTLRPPIG